MSLTLKIIQHINLYHHLSVLITSYEETYKTFRSTPNNCEIKPEINILCFVLQKFCDFENKLLEKTRHEKCYCSTIDIFPSPIFDKFTFLSSIIFLNLSYLLI